VSAVLVLREYRKRLLLGLAALAVAFGPAGPTYGGDSLFGPVPIGPGPEYRPPAGWPLAAGAAFGVAASAYTVGSRFDAKPEYRVPAGWPLAALGGLPGDVRSGARIHLELFANRLVVVVPGGIGVSAGRTTLYGFITDAPWHAPAWTTEAGGVVHLSRPGMRLGDVFAIWGQPLGADRMLTWTGPVRAFVDGERVSGDPAAITLSDGEQIVIEIGGYVPPHPSFAFRPR
jgi:hypothetical protein